VLALANPAASGKLLRPASPMAAGKLVYFVNEAGETFVLEPGPKLNVVTENSVGAASNELFRASPAVSRGQIFLRSQTNLYCIGKGKAE